MSVPRHSIIVTVTLLLAAGAFFCAPRTHENRNAKIADFAACAAAGNPVMESHPRQCRTPDGQIFTEPLPPASGACRNLCGNGTCEEVVCMAVGCPCAETARACPQDCSNKNEP